MQTAAVPLASAESKQAQATKAQEQPEGGLGHLVLVSGPGICRELPCSAARWMKRCPIVDVGTQGLWPSVGEDWEKTDLHIDARHC